MSNTSNASKNVKRFLLLFALGIAYGFMYVMPYMKSSFYDQMIAAMCEYPQATHASSALMKEGKLEVTREIDGGYEVLDLTLPAVVTADLRLNAPRYVTLPMMMKAKRKPQEVVMASALCPDLRAHVEVVGYEAPEARKVGRKVANVDELIDKLKNEAKVL